MHDVSPHPRRALVVPTALALLALAAAGCASSPSKEPPKRTASGKLAELPEGAPPPSSTKVTDVAAQSGPGALDYVMVVPENVVWLPWKTLYGAGKGANDGVYAGFQKSQYPIFGLVFSPINLAAGFVTGFFEGMFMSPGVVGPSDDFGRAMKAPTKRTTTIWWFPD